MNEKKAQERENLRNIILQWNGNRLDLFELSEPNEELEFHGVMRYYFQDSGQKVATKCIRVSSTATSRDVIHTLIEKFRPDIRMLYVPEYALYEIHENGEERKLGEEEKPLLVQLNWHKDDREGRFLLRRMDEKSILPITMDPEARSFRRKLSKREKKEKKKKEKKERLREQQQQKENKDGIAEKLYSELPETSFTRSISNPEAVMRRRRQQKLERKLQQFRQEGGPQAGGTLRIFGETLNKDVPYKTLLLSTRDSASYVVKEILDKYSMDGEDPAYYCLVQVIIPHPMVMGGMEAGHEYHRGTSIREYILDDDDCPLCIEKSHNRNKGILTFHIRRRPSDYQPRKRKKKSKLVKGELDNGYKEDPAEKLPYLLEVNPDGSDVQQGIPKKHRLYLNMTEVGSDVSSSSSGGHPGHQNLQLFGPNVQPRHCVLAHTEGIVTVTPSSRDAETYVNAIRIYETTILQHRAVIRFGKLHTFRFIDHMQEERRRMSPESHQFNKDNLSMHSNPQSMSLPPNVSSLVPPVGYETTFDAEGNVETVSTHSKDDRMSRKSDDLHSHRSFGGREGAQSRGGDKNEPPQMLRRGNDPILPAVLEFWEDGEDAFLNAVIGQPEASQVQFKLSPTYILYMAARYRASTHYRPEASPADRAHRLTALMIKIAGLLHHVIQEHYQNGSSLAFWLANASELLHFLKQDRHVCAYTLDAQDLLAESVQLAFRSLVACQQSELHLALPHILDDQDDLHEEEGATGQTLAVLSAAMSLLRRCRVNAALTIQLFSQLFHHVNMWLFNRLVVGSDALCTRLWGLRLKRRLVRIEVWAEKQGLELAADCHLSRIIQAAHLLQCPKSNAKDAANISSACFKLNSLQLRNLLERYQPEPNEPGVSRELVETVCELAQGAADDLAQADGREVRLEEDPDLQLPFLLPEDGYSCDIVRGVPVGLQDYLQPMLHAGLCRLTIQPTSSGFWTIYMSDQDVGKIASTGTRSPSVQSSHHGEGEVLNGGRGSTLQNHEPEVLAMKLQKSNNGMGLSIVAARGVGQDKLGIYVKSVVKGGAADQDGRLQAGDQLLKVDGHSLVGISQEKAAEFMTRTGPVVTLEVAKQGAIYHGLAALLSQPSPVMQRGSLHAGPRRMSERDIPGRLVQDQNTIGAPRMQGSKSVPSLNSKHPGLDLPHHPSQQAQETYNPAYSTTSSTASIPKTLEQQHHHHLSHPAGHPGPEAQIRYPKAGPTLNNNNNLNNNPPHYEPRPYQGEHPTAAIPATNGRPGHLHPHTLAEERHYQNISLYQQSGYNPQRPTYLPQQGQPGQQWPLHGSHSSLVRPGEHHQVSQQGTPDRMRPLSTLISHREQEQYANSLNHRVDYKLSEQAEENDASPGIYQQHPLGYGSSVAPHNIHHQNEVRQLDPRQADPRQLEARQIDPRQSDPRQRDLLRQEAKMDEMREEVRRREERDIKGHPHPISGPGHPQNWGGPHLQGNPIIPASAMPPHLQNGPRMTLGHNGPPAPPTVPKPRQPMPKNPHLPDHLKSYEGGSSDPHHHNRHPVYRESPPPPPPPSNTHPLLQSSQPSAIGPNGMPVTTPAVSYRFGPSGYPPRPEGQVETNQPNRNHPHHSPAQEQQKSNQVLFAKKSGMIPPVGGRGLSSVPADVSRMNQQIILSADKKEFGVTSPSPWEREEKEKLRMQRLDEARRIRDNEIRDLEGSSARTQKQEDRLRALRLEQEFQRRAEETRNDEEEDDDELLDRAENRERILRMQDELARTRQRRQEWEQQEQQRQQINLNHRQQQQHIIQQEEWARRQHQEQQRLGSSNETLVDQESRLRQLRLEEVTRKRELEAAREAEENLLREARRRQDEDFHHTGYPAQPSGPQRLESLLGGGSHPLPSSSKAPSDSPPALPSSSPPKDHYETPSGAQRLEHLVSAPYHLEKTLPPPVLSPEKRPGPAIVGRPHAGVLRNGENSHPPTTQKKVSFHDVRLETEIASDDGYTLDDIDEVLAGGGNSAPSSLEQSSPLNNSGQSSVLNLSNSSSITPGVIGAQEVYRDPRQRIAEERYHQNVSSGGILRATPNQGPEKLSFREKMKMFALETGEDETPKDKVKISKAQREIETRNILVGGGHQAVQQT